MKERRAMSEVIGFGNALSFARTGLSGSGGSTESKTRISRGSWDCSLVGCPTREETFCVAEVMDISGSLMARWMLSVVNRERLSTVKIVSCRCQEQ